MAFHIQTIIFKVIDKNTDYLMTQIQKTDPKLTQISISRRPKANREDKAVYIDINIDIRVYFNNNRGNYLTHFVTNCRVEMTDKTKS